MGNYKYLKRDFPQRHTKIATYTRYPLPPPLTTHHVSKTFYNKKIRSNTIPTANGVIFTSHSLQLNVSQANPAQPPRSPHFFSERQAINRGYPNTQYGCFLTKVRILCTTYQYDKKVYLLPESKSTIFTQ